MTDVREDVRHLVEISTIEDDQFNQVVREARAIKEQLVDVHYAWYRKNKWVPFFLFRGAGVLTIVLGVTLPAVAAFPSFTHKDLILAVMSVTIAALTGLASFFRWERSWRGRFLTEFAIENLTAKWELELVNARLVLDPAERIKHVYLATNDLISNFRSISFAETEDFFSRLQFPQSERSESASSAGKTRE